MSGDHRGPNPFPPARKSLGQHFLHDHAILRRIADATGAGREDTVIEIGPGRGTLTDLLRDRARRVLAIELDQALAALLRERYRDDPRVEIVQADVLEVELSELAGGEYLLVGNVPYYITTPIIFHALRPPRPRCAVYMVQREVAVRLAAAPGRREYGALSVNVQSVAAVELLFRVPAGAFVPPPKVESAVVRVTPRGDPLVAPDLEDRFRTFVIGAFGARRKQMRRVLRTVTGMSMGEAEAVLAAADVRPEARPEVLEPAEFARIVELLTSNTQPGCG